jgi:hypothetical protein
MHPPIHPDHAFVSRLQDPNSELFQTSNDRKRGFDPKSASIHSVSPSNPSDPSPPGLFSGSGHRTPDFIIPVSGTGSGASSHQNSLFTSSPLQNHVPVDYTVPTQGYIPNTNTNTNFNFNSEGIQAQDPWGINTALQQPQPPPLSVPPAVDFLQPDMGFDWMNWMSTANVAMGPVEEQNGIP